MDWRACGQYLSEWFCFKPEGIPPIHEGDLPQEVTRLFCSAPICRSILEMRRIKHSALAAYDINLWVTKKII
jgi:hypothetical protein